MSLLVPDKSYLVWLRNFFYFKNHNNLAFHLGPIQPPSGEGPPLFAELPTQGHRVNSMNATSVPFTSSMPRFMNSESRDSNLAQLNEQLKRYHYASLPLPQSPKSHLGSNVINSDNVKKCNKNLVVNIFTAWWRFGSKVHSFGFRQNIIILRNG